MDKNKRQKRIVQKKRNLKKWIDREQVKKKMWSNSTAPLSDSEERSARINANHGKRCSCPMCGNPRKFKSTNLTMQEKKSNEKHTVDYFDSW